MPTDARLPNGSRSLGIMTMFWLLATIIFVNVYSSCMSSYMSMQFQRPDIATLEDLANSRQYLPTTIKGGTAAFLFQVITDKPIDLFTH